MASRRANANTKFRFGGDFELDLGAYELRCSGEPLKLARIPMEVLQLLIKRRGQLVRRDQIIENIWGKDISIDVDRNINEIIKKIRKVLQEDAGQPRFVKTVYTQGYRFIAPVKKVSTG